jgi:succinylglutamate desuccinylase
MIPLLEIDEVPKGLLEIEEASQLHSIMPHPTLLFLEGQKKEPLFVTVLLHGNEDTGLLAIQKILRKYEDHRLPRSLIVFFGNIYAAKEGLRRLEGQPDYNRVWPGGDESESEEGDLIARVVERVTSHRLFASIDIHNNTGKNPHYGCINSLDHDFLYLASLFGRIVVFFETPTGVQSLAMAKYSPSITIECGKPHLQKGTDHAAEFVDSLLHLSVFPDHVVKNEKELDVCHTVAKVVLPEAYTFSYSDRNADIRLLSSLEESNFSMLDEGTVFAYVKEESEARFEVYDDADRECFDDYFNIVKGEIRLKKPLMPSMITLDEHVIRQDCFCYLMERIDLEKDMI